jgi:hypothetical protein
MNDRNLCWWRRPRHAECRERIHFVQIVDGGAPTVTGSGAAGADLIQYPLVAATGDAWRRA